MEISWRYHRDIMQISWVHITLQHQQSPKMSSRFHNILQINSTGHAIWITGKTTRDFSAHWNSSHGSLAWLTRKSGPFMDVHPPNMVSIGFDLSTYFSAYFPQLWDINVPLLSKIIHQVAWRLCSSWSFSRNALDLFRHLAATRSTGTCKTHPEKYTVQ